MRYKIFTFLKIALITTMKQVKCFEIIYNTFYNASFMHNVMSLMKIISTQNGINDETYFLPHWYPFMDVIKIFYRVKVYFLLTKVYDFYKKNCFMRRKQKLNIKYFLKNLAYYKFLRSVSFKNCLIFWFVLCTT